MPALELLTALLAGNDSSPIRETLVKKRKLCVEAAGHALHLKHGGVLAFIGAFLPPGDHASRRKVMTEICEAFVEDGPDPAAFAQHLKRFRMQRASDRYSPKSHLLGLGEAEFLQNDYQKYEEGLKDMEAVTPARVQTLARSLFAQENTLELDLTPEHTPWWMWPLGLMMRMWPR